MQNLMINGHPYKGTFSIIRSKNNNNIEISGMLKIENYIEEIDEISSSRYVVKGIDVFQESFGSEDKNIIYSFYAKELIIIE